MQTIVTKITPESMMTAGDILICVIRILIAAVMGMTVGLERLKRQKDAGVRTHCIIAMSSAVFMVISKYAFIDIVEAGYVVTVDPSRVAAGVVTGISFIGAGVIFKDRISNIKGLTTAAGMWATAAIGMCFGAGLYIIGFVATGLILISQYLLHKIPFFSTNMQNEIVLYVKYEQGIKKKVEDYMITYGGTIEQVNAIRKNEELMVKFIVRSNKKIPSDAILSLMEKEKSIYTMSN